MRITTLPDAIDTLVVGAGHAGLVTSALLREAGEEHVVLERRDRLGGGWQDRWDGFTLVTPNWLASFPGLPYDGGDPDGYMPRDEIAARVARYADVIDAPVALGTAVERLNPAGGGFDVRTSRGRLRARRAIIATGSYHLPRVPSTAASLAPGITQLHAHEYRNAAQLPDGPVLVVGSAQTGVQIAEELAEAGRRVYLSVGGAGRAPRRYRGRDLFWWLASIARQGPELGMGLPTVDRLPHPDARFQADPHLSGRNGGHDTDLRRLAAEGMQLAGRFVGADGERVTFAPDLPAQLDRADRFFDERFRGLIDAYIERAGVSAPPDDRVVFPYEPEPITHLDLRQAGVSTVIWATGYAADFSWIDAPIFDERGYPRHDRGITAIDGLAFIGLRWQHTQASATLIGPTLDGPHVLERLAMVPA